MNKISWTIFTVLIVGILALLVVSSKNTSLDVSKINTDTVQTANSQNGDIGDHINGKSGSKVTLIEYGDYQCPGCGEINPTIETVVNAYKNQIQFIFRNFPLTSIHQNAKSAAGAVEAAGLQGKYWEMHDKIYASQSDWENLSGNDLINMFSSYAGDFKLDTAKFKTDMASTAVNDKITYDQALGNKLKLNSTPTFYLNGAKLEPAIWSDKTKLESALNDELNKAGITPPTITE
ncbi:MAG: DsbA family protein [Candidatus Saccharibacteria bacterium]